METGSEALERLMKAVTDRLNRQEELIQILVDDLKERNKDGKLFIRGERMYDSIELRKMLLLGKRTLQRYRSEGKIAYIKLKRTCFYRESDVVRMLEEHGRSFDQRAKDKFIAGVKTSKLEQSDK